MTNRAYQVRSRLEKLEYIHSTQQDMGHIFGVEDVMLTRSIKHVEELIGPKGWAVLKENYEVRTGAKL